MLRLHFLQHWFNLSDPAAEEVDDLLSRVGSLIYGPLGRTEIARFDIPVPEGRHDIQARKRLRARLSLGIDLLIFGRLGALGLTCSRRSTAAHPWRLLIVIY